MKLTAKAKTKLRKLAEGMTQPGPYRIDSVKMLDGLEHTILDGNGFWLCAMGRSPRGDARYLAAVSPDVVLALLDEIDVLTEVGR